MEGKFARATRLPSKHFSQDQKLFPSVSMAGVEARFNAILFFVNHFYDECHVDDLLKLYQLSSSMPNLLAFELGQSSGLLNTAPSPVAVLPILVLPSVLKLPICV